MLKLKSSFGLLQKIGASLMLPVSVLPVAGILLGIGSSHFGWMSPTISDLMAQAGGAIFGALPLIFAIAVAVGLTGNDGVAALAATVGFVVLLATMGAVTHSFGYESKLVMGIQSIDTGVFGGIVIGSVSAVLFKKYYKIQLPDYLGFFAGKRFVPIITAMSAIVVGIILSLIWPTLQSGINTLSHFAAYENPAIAATLYGFIERMLVPFGLHHIWNVPFFFEIGEYIDKSGKIIHGDINRFFAGDPTAGILGGAYLFKMWGLPAAAIAMWQSAKPEYKAKTGSIMISAALASFLTGITEPIEFSFLFVAPILYFIHALLAGFSQFLFGIFGAKLGFTFSHGFIDYILYYSMDTKPWLVLILGPIFGIVYYSIFRAVILKFNLKTPGREIEEFLSVESIVKSSGQEKAIALVRAVGGRKNIKSLDACITRLRIELNDMQKLNAEKLKELGAAGVLTVGNGIQAIFGPLSENLKTQMEEILRSNLPDIDDVENPSKKQNNLYGQVQQLKQTLSEEISPTIRDEASRWLEALGGSKNLLSTTYCAKTRVRIEMTNTSLINENALRECGVKAIMRLNNKTVHLILGHSASQYAQVFQELLRVK